MIRAIIIATIAAAVLANCSPPAAPAPAGSRYHAQDAAACARQPDMPWCTE